MTIEKISPSKLRVYIAESDMQEWSLKPEMLTYNSPEAQMLFNDIIVQAKQEYDFVCDGANVVIEAVPDEKSGLKVMLTVVDGNNNSVDGTPLTDEASLSRHKRIILKLNDIEDVYCAVKNLINIYNGQSHLFKYEGQYYIVLLSKEITYNSIYDLGEIVDNADIFYGFLNEYGELVVKNDFIKSIA